ncbi:MAG: leucine--tRNA ligase, partial [Methanobacteriota archaeon]
MVDLRNIERKWQQKWREDHIFEPVVDPKKPKYFITVPYPYTSGPLHIGHGRTYTIGDIFARYKRMRGFNVLFPMAFHVTGTPILAVSKGIEKGDPTTLQQYREYLSLYIKDPKKIEETLKGFRDPWKVAQFFAQIISEDYDALGFSIDWTRRFTTFDPSYSRFISWQFEFLRRKGFVVQGEHPVLYCLSCDNAVGEDDIEGGDTLDLSIQEFTAIKFPCRDGYLVAATLRPETVFGLTNLWVNPEGEYVKVRVDGETWYVSSEAAEKLSHQGHEIKILEAFDGRKLVGEKCGSPVSDKQ